MTSSDSQSGGVGFLGLLALVFIVLKLTKFIAWSWIWVLSPLWVPAALAIAFLIVIAIGAAGAALLRKAT